MSKPNPKNEVVAIAKKAKEQLRLANKKRRT